MQPRGSGVLFSRAVFACVASSVNASRLLGGKIRENLAIEFDAGEFQTVHELRIVQAVQTRAAAPMRTIHSERKSRFFSLRPV